MANESITKIKTKTINIPDEKIQPVREVNQQLSQIVNQLGSAHIRRKELEETVSQLEEDFQNLNTKLRETITELEKEYPRGNLDLDSGTLTVSEEVADDSPIATE